MNGTDAVQLRLFGSPRVVRDGAPLAFDTRKALALLALLAVTGTEHRRESLADLLWPELDATRARAALRRTLSVTAAIGPGLRVEATGVRVDPEAVRADVVEFRALARASEPNAWARAVELADDDFLAGFSLRDSPAFDDWQLATADALRDELSQTLARLVQREVGRGDLAAALGHARRRTRIGGVSEPAHADLIRVLAWSGDRPGALRAYRALIRLLDSELGVPPLPETLALHDDIRGDRLAPPRRPGAAEAPPASPLGSAPALIGRGAELDRLWTAWTAAPDAGRIIGLAGDPGIGRSSLLRALADRVGTTGATRILIAGHAAERALAYAAASDLARALIAGRPDLASRLGNAIGPLAALVDGLGSDGGAAIRTPGDQQRLHEAFRAMVAAAAQEIALLVVVDDAHLLDGPSADLLGYLARRVPRGLLLAASWARGSGDTVLPASIAGAGEVITLGPLDEAAIAALVVGSGAEPAEVLRRTRGIPLLVREFTTADAPNASADARAIVSARLSGAPALTRQLVGAAAVVGTVADPELLRVAWGRDEIETVDAIEDAVGRGLLVERLDRDGYDVPHELLRDLALADLSLARARLLHGRTADLLARRHGVDPLLVPAGSVARHLAGAGRDEEAGEWFLAAARESIRLAAHEEALEQLEAARTRGHAPVEVHELLGSTLVRLGRYAEALVALDQAAAVAESEPARLGAIEHAIARVQDRLGDWELALAHLDAAWDLLAEDPAQRVRVLADRALVQHRLGRLDGARSTARAAVTAATSIDGSARAQAANVLGVIELAAGDPAALDRLGDAVRLARDTGDLDLQIAALNNLAHAAADADPETAMRSAREALAGAERQGDLHRLAALHSHLADLLHAAGRQDEALAELRSSATAFAGIQDAAIRPEVWTLSEW